MQSLKEKLEKSENFKLDHTNFSLGYSCIPKLFYIQLDKLMSLLSKNLIKKN